MESIYCRLWASYFKGWVVSAKQPTVVVRYVPPYVTTIAPDAQVKLFFLIRFEDLKLNALAELAKNDARLSPLQLYEMDELEKRLNR